MSNLETPRTKKRRIRESAGLGNLSNSNNNSKSNSNSNGIVRRNGPVILQEDYFNLAKREEFRKMKQTKKNKRKQRRKTLTNLGLSISNSNSNSNNEGNNEGKFQNFKIRTETVNIPSHLKRKGPAVTPKFITPVKASNPPQKASNSKNSLGPYSPIVLTSSSSSNSLGSYPPIVLTPSPEQLKASNSPLKSTNKIRSRRTRNNRNKKTKKYVNYKFTNNQGSYKQ